MTRLLLVLVATVACSGQTPLPKGPPPEYEDDPMPAQDAAPAPSAAAVVVDAGATE